MVLLYYLSRLVTTSKPRVDGPTHPPGVTPVSLSPPYALRATSTPLVPLGKTYRRSSQVRLSTRH